jgi:hypothetical protein
METYPANDWVFAGTRRLVYERVGGNRREAVEKAKILSLSP